MDVRGGRPQDRAAGQPASGLVTIEAPWGHGDWIAPAVQAGPVWTRTLRAPDTASTTVIEVHIDNQPVKIRPRVWWD